MALQVTEPEPFLPVLKFRTVLRCLSVPETTLCWTQEAGREWKGEKKCPSLNSLGPKLSRKHASVSHLFSVSNIFK